MAVLGCRNWTRAVAPAAEATEARCRAGAGSVKIEVWADGEKLFPSGETEIVTGRDPAQRVDVDLTGKHRLTLLVTSAGDDPANDRVSWGRRKAYVLALARASLWFRPFTSP